MAAFTLSISVTRWAHPTGTLSFTSWVMAASVPYGSAETRKIYDTSQTVDLNTIPQFLLQGVDVVTGGASAVYGSDAIAGVVNFRLRNNVQGVEVGAQYGLTGQGDGSRLLERSIQ